VYHFIHVTKIQKKSLDYKLLFLLFYKILMSKTTLKASTFLEKALPKTVKIKMEFDIREFV